MRNEFVGEDIVIGIGHKLEPEMSIEDYFTPIDDDKVPVPYQHHIPKYRQLSGEHDVPRKTPICWKVRAGFTLIYHAQTVDHCDAGAKYSQGEKTFGITKDCLVFFVPSVMKHSTLMSVRKQQNLLNYVRKKLMLPESHLSNFGSVTLVAGLIFIYRKLTEIRLPHDMWVRTDTRGADGHRFYLGGFGDAGLRCRSWDIDDDSGSELGVFALGVEPTPQIF